MLEKIIGSNVFRFYDFVLLWCSHVIYFYPCFSFCFSFHLFLSYFSLRGTSDAWIYYDRTQVKILCLRSAEFEVPRNVYFYHQAPYTFTILYSVCCNAESDAPEDTEDSAEYWRLPKSLALYLLFPSWWVRSASALLTACVPLDLITRQ